MSEEDSPPGYPGPFAPAGMPAPPGMTYGMPPDLAMFGPIQTPGEGQMNPFQEQRIREAVHNTSVLCTAEGELVLSTERRTGSPCAAVDRSVAVAGPVSRRPLSAPPSQRREEPVEVLSRWNMEGVGEALRAVEEWRTPTCEQLRMRRRPPGRK